MGIYVNRTLNLKKIKAIGFDMDYTLVRYNTTEFENLTFNAAIKKLIQNKGYPERIKEAVFDISRAIRGLVIDKRNGNILKLNLFGRIKKSYHGTKEIDFKTQCKFYGSDIIDLRDDNFFCIDSAFSLSQAALYAALVDFKEGGMNLPEFSKIADEITEMIDEAHKDNTLKNEVIKDMDRFILKDPDLVPALMKLKNSGKKLFIVTNSDFSYTDTLLTYSVNPFLPDGLTWDQFFDITITFAEKPSFFMYKRRFLKVNLKDKTMTNYEGKLSPGVYQSGHAVELLNFFSLEGDEILYLGDHIYGDIVALKKQIRWRTALIVDEIDEEVALIKNGLKVLKDIEHLMVEKEKTEDTLNHLYGNLSKKELFSETFKNIDRLNEKLEVKIKEYESLFNPYWGEIMRAGNEESRFASQVEKYACIYMSKVSDLNFVSPRKYFRPKRRLLPHDPV